MLALSDWTQCSNNLTLKWDYQCEKNPENFPGHIELSWDDLNQTWQPLRLSDRFTDSNKNKTNKKNLAIQVDRFKEASVLNLSFTYSSHFRLSLPPSVMTTPEWRAECPVMTSLLVWIYSRLWKTMKICHSDLLPGPSMDEHSYLAIRHSQHTSIKIWHPQQQSINA